MPRTIAPSIGHTATHCGPPATPAHSVHTAASIRKPPLTWRTAPAAHFGRHQPQLMQLSAILSATPAPLSPVP